MKKVTLLLALIAGLFISESQAQLTMDLQLRSRAEYLNGYKKLPTEASTPSYFVGQRSRLSLKYKSEKFKVGISIQDVRTWGDDAVVNATGMWGSPSSMDLYEAWGQYMFTESISLKLGRQAIKYDDQRLLCARNWAHAGLSYDAAVFKYKKDGLAIDAGMTYNNATSALFAVPMTDALRMKSMKFLHLNKKVSDNFKISGLVLATSFQQATEDGEEVNTDNNTKITVGTFAKYNTDALSTIFSAYYQTGQARTGTDVAAYFFNLDIGYNVSKLRLGLGIDYLSGDDTETTDKVESFDMLYGARYKFYGFMNQFLTEGSTKGTGLVDIYGKVKYKFNKKANVEVIYHMFQTAQTYTYMDGVTSAEADKALASEIDMHFNYKLTKGASLKVGYNMIFATETLERMRGKLDKAETASFGYVMFTFAPQIFSNK